MSYNKIYRNIYLKGYKKFPYQKLTGRNDLYYTGELICGVTGLPPGFDKNQDYFIGCDCEFPKIRRLVKIKSKK